MKNPAIEFETLEGKVTVITGASRGIGKATAFAFAEAGAKLVLAARTPDDVENVAAQLRQEGVAAIAVPTDVTQVDAVARLFQQTLDAYQRVDILVNNAGGGRFGPVEDFTPSDWDSVLDANLTSVFLCAKSALPAMFAQDSGHIVNVLSIAARETFAASGAYCAAKAGALAFTKVLAAEVRQRNIRVTAVLPGSVHTSFWEGASAHPPFERMLKPAHVAEAVVSVCRQPLGMVTDEIVVMPPFGIL